MKGLFNHHPKSKIFIYILFLLVLFAFLTGCWDRREVNDMMFIIGVGLDKPEQADENNQVELSVEYVIPGQIGIGQPGMGGGSGPPINVRSSSGESIFDAMSKLQKETSRQIFWGHNKVVVFGEELAKQGIERNVDFLARYPEPRLRSNVFVVKGKAKDILGAELKLEKFPSEEMRELSNLQILQDVSVNELLQMLASESKQASMPIVEKAQTDKGDDKIILAGTAVFKDHKMSDELDAETTRGLLWILGEIRQASVTVNPEDTEGNISFKMLRSTTTLEPKIEKDKWKMIIKVKTEDDVTENNTTLDVMNPTIVKELETLLEKDVDTRIQQAIDKVQKEMKIDIFGFGEAFHKKYPKEWQKVKDRWDDMFQDVEVVIESKVDVERPGNSTAPQGIPEEQVKEE